MDILAKIKKVKDIGADISSRVGFTSFDGEQRTPLRGEEAQDKPDTLDFIHSYCRADLANILQAFTEVRSHSQALPVVSDIYQEGVLIHYIPADVVLDDALLNAQRRAASDPVTDTQATDAQYTDAQTTDSQTTNIPVDTVMQHPACQNIFVPFRIQDASIDERFYYLYYEALIRLGKMQEIAPSKVTRHYFNVSKTEYVTANMLRLHLTSDVPLPTDDPGFAYRFVLTKLSKQDETQANTKLGANIRRLPKQAWQQLQPAVQRLPLADKLLDTAKRQGTIVFFEVLKRLPESQREKLEAKAVGLDEGRYYTLRQVHKPHLDNEKKALIGEVDIYIHEGSPGSEWAKSLRAGDMIYADNDYEETIKLMTIGQPLFICDETSMPSVAAMLERWHIETVPIVIAITNDQAEVDYMQQISLPDGLQDKLDIHYIDKGVTDSVSQAAIEHIKAQDTKIDCAWGAIGKKDFKPIKAYLRMDHGLKGKINRIRAYWR